ncbi:MAG: hypothetical protein GY768_22915 [Planctomycetaceae bacterium]|nr:hypothetical protein [Planctomycetaceae bacterium]
MTFPLLRKIINDSRWLLLSSVITLFVFAWIRVAIVSSMETYQLQRIARNLPEMIKRLSPVPIEDLIFYPGLIGFTFEEPMVYLIMAVWTVSRASDCVSGELGRGTMEMLLSQPIGRVKYLLVHTSVTLAGVLLLATAAYAGTHVGVERSNVKVKVNVARWQAPFGFQLPNTQAEENVKLIPMTTYVKPQVFQAAAINYACFGVFLAGVTTALSCCDRYRWRTIALVVAFYVFQTILELTGMAVDGFRWLLRFTFFSIYEPVAFSTQASKDLTSSWRFLAKESTGSLPDLGPLGYDAILLSLGLVGILLGVWIFRRRDLPAPL